MLKVTLRKVTRVLESIEGAAIFSHTDLVISNFIIERLRDIQPLVQR